MCQFEKNKMKERKANRKTIRYKKRIIKLEPSFLMYNTVIIKSTECDSVFLFFHLTNIH